MYAKYNDDGERYYLFTPETLAEWIEWAIDYILWLVFSLKDAVTSILFAAPEEG